MVCGFFKGLVRAGLIVALAGGAAAVIAGPHRVHALVDQARHRIQVNVDQLIDDPTAIRAQLRELEGQYPGRISEVRQDLDEVTRHLTQLQNLREESLGVVELTSADLSQMNSLLTQAEAAQAQSGNGTIVRVRFNESSLNVADAYAKANRLTQIQDAYQTRATELDRDIGYVNQQKDRLAELLSQLETEQAEFRAQLWQLDRQVDTIARNERMIHILKKREARIDRQSRYSAASLDQITARLAEVRAEQEGKLEQFKQTSDIQAYENAARFRLNTKKTGTTGKEAKSLKPIEISPTVIEINPERETTGQTSSKPACPSTGDIALR